MSSNIIPSISYDQHDILKWIIQLHTGPFHCDVTYGKGNFYRDGVPEPELKFDLVPLVPGVVQADCRRLPLAAESVESIVFDPPFMARTGPGAALKARFGELVGTIRDLWKFYALAMMEFYRVLVRDGWLVFKCQDGVLSGVNNFTHCEVYNLAVAIGFKPIDLFILLAKFRMMHPKHKRQRHARKYHSYFWVLRKEG